jgi:beta-glucanase (GH16 family)
MKRSTIFLSIILITLFNACDNKDDDVVPGNTVEVPEGYSYVWADEFNGDQINMANWNYETGDGTEYGLPAGWGNNEKQIYTTSDENSKIVNDEGNSVLAITALSDNTGGYTSARMTTKDKTGVRFGRIDVRAKFPEGQGLWPAIWMLGENIDLISWPGCGEIDITEVLGHETSTLYTTLHYTNASNAHGQDQQVYNLDDGSFSDDYHVFSLDWTPESMIFSLDGEQYFQISIATDMKEFQRSFYLVLNVAVGGDLPGDPDPTTTFPQTMYVDYIRVYSKNDLEIPEAPELNIEEETIGQYIAPGLADHAVRDGFTELGNIGVIVWGGGGEPEISGSEISIDGDSSLSFNFPGGNWGGGYIEMAEPKDLSNYSSIHFSIRTDDDFTDAEIKLESTSTNASIFLKNYTGTVVAEGFTEYAISLSDFSGLDPSELTIPFAMWNPLDNLQNYYTGLILIDNIYFSN